MRPTALSTALRPEPSPRPQTMRSWWVGISFAPALDQRPIGIEQQLGIIERAAIALVDADGDDHTACLHASPIARVAGDGMIISLFKQPEVFRVYLERPQHEAKIGIIWHDRLRERRELHALAAGQWILRDDLIHSALHGYRARG